MKAGNTTLEHVIIFVLVGVVVAVLGLGLIFIPKISDSLFGFDMCISSRMSTDDFSLWFKGYLNPARPPELIKDKDLMEKFRSFYECFKDDHGRVTKKIGELGLTDYEIYRIGRACFNTEEYILAEAALAAIPKYEDAMYLNGEVHYKMNEFIEATKYFDAYLSDYALTGKYSAESQAWLVLTKFSTPGNIYQIGCDKVLADTLALTRYDLFENAVENIETSTVDKFTIFECVAVNLANYWSTHRSDPNEYFYWLDARTGAFNALMHSARDINNTGEFSWLYNKMNSQNIFITDIEPVTHFEGTEAEAPVFLMLFASTKVIKSADSLHSGYNLISGLPPIFKSDGSMITIIPDVTRIGDIAVEIADNSGSCDSFKAIQRNFYNQFFPGSARYVFDGAGIITVPVLRINVKDVPNNQWMCYYSETQGDFFRWSSAIGEEIGIERAIDLFGPFFN